MLQNRIALLPIWVFVIIHALFWLAMMLIARPNLDSYGDMIEVYGWSQHFLLGSNKHPQFLPWMAHFWFAIMPQSIPSFYGFSAFNLAIGLIGVNALGKACGLDMKRRQIAIALCVLAFPYLTLPAKLNMNSILISVWPWTCWAFVKMLPAMGWRKIAYAILMGLLAAASVFSKYFTIVLLASLFVLSVTPKYRVLYKSFHLYLAGIVFCLALAPHIYWLFEHDFVMFKYAEEQSAGGVNWEYIGRFGVAPVLYWIIPLTIALFVFMTGKPLRRIAMLLRIENINDDIFYLAVLPWGFTMMVGLLGLADLSSPWVIPLGFAFTLLMARNISQNAIEQWGDKFIGSFVYIWPIMLIGGAIFVGFNSFTAHRWHYTPEMKLSKAIARSWERQSPEQQPLWAAPSRNAQRFSFFSHFPKHVEALPSYPNSLPAYYPRLADWKEKPGIYLCSIVKDTQSNEGCINQAHKWAQDNGFEALEHREIAAQQGWRFWYNHPHAIDAIFMFPKKEN